MRTFRARQDPNLRLLPSEGEDFGAFYFVSPAGLSWVASAAARSHGHGTICPFQALLRLFQRRVPAGSRKERSMKPNLALILAIGSEHCLSRPLVRGQFVSAAAV